MHAQGIDYLRLTVDDLERMPEMLQRHVYLIGANLKGIQAKLNVVCREMFHLHCSMTICVALVWMTAGLMLGFLLGMAV